MTILTPKRRQLTRHALRTIDVTVAAWRRKTGAWSTYEKIGLAIRSGMLQRHLIKLAMEADAIPRGRVRVPAIKQGESNLCSNMPSFGVDLDELLVASAKEGTPSARHRYVADPGGR